MPKNLCNCGGFKDVRSKHCRTCREIPSGWAKEWHLHKRTGYMIRFFKGERQLQHREVMKAFLKRELLSSEHVHHINGIKTDNRIENLEVLPVQEHRRLHRFDRDSLGRFIKGTMHGDL